MFSWLKKLSGGRRSISGFTPVNGFIEGSAEKIAGAVVQQLSVVHATQQQLSVMRSFLLGYVATLAEQFALASGRDDASNAGALIAILASQKIPQVANDAESLMGEFTACTQQRDYGFGQGGSVALEDFPLLRRGSNARGLLEYFQPSAG